MALIEIKLGDYVLEQLLDSLTSLHQKVDILMTDVQTLSDTLDAIIADVASVTTDVSSLETEITALQAQVASGNSIDLTSVLAKAAAIKASLDALVPTQTPAPGASSLNA